jgi:hypothetical protein
LEERERTACAFVDKDLAAEFFNAIVGLDLGSLVAVARRPLLACPKRIEDDMSCCKVWEYGQYVMKMRFKDSSETSGLVPVILSIFRMTETFKNFSLVIWIKDVCLFVGYWYSHLPGLMSPI